MSYRPVSVVVAMTSHISCRPFWCTHLRYQHGVEIGVVATKYLSYVENQGAWILLQWKTRNIANVLEFMLKGLLGM